MIEYVVESNPDDRILKRASQLLSEGQLVALPTDTNWIIACDAFSKHGVEKLYRLSHADPTKHFSVICDSLSRANDIAEISNQAFRKIRNKIPGHYTFVFKATKKVTKVLKASKRDKEIGIRFPPNTLPLRLVEAHDNVLLSNNVTHEMLNLDDGSIEIYGYLIEEYLGHALGMILDPGEFQFAGSSTIVNFVNEPEIQIERVGAGDPKGFE